MIAILQWTTLAVCGIVALARIPSAVRGHNRSIFGIFSLATFAMLLSIDVTYTAVDTWLGSQNYANVILRFVIYGTVLLAGYRIARGFDAAPSVRLIIGPVGITVLSVVVVATVLPFLLANTAGTSTGLAALPDQSRHNVDLIRLYTAAGRLYPSYVAACLLPATIRAITSRLPLTVRAGAAVLSVGGAAMFLMSFAELIPRSVSYLQFVISSTAVLGLVLGLALIWLGSIMAKRTARQRTASAEISRHNHSQNH